MGCGCKKKRAFGQSLKEQQTTQKPKEEKKENHLVDGNEENEKDN